MGVKIIKLDAHTDILGHKQLKAWILRVVESEKKELGDVVIALCSDNYIIAENKRFLSHNYPTDIITFDYCEQQIVSGDLLISVETVKRNAKLWSVRYRRELERVMVHGVLHLCGYGDKTDQEQVVMRGKEDFYLQVLDEIQV